MHLDLLFTPVPLNRATVENKTVVVIDVLRASTSICAMLQAGARGVIPTTGPGEAGDMRAKVGPDVSVLAGERDGVKIENFHFGNSPAEFTKETVGDKFVVMSSTNGTPVFKSVAGGQVVMTAGLVNVSRVAERVADEDADVLVVCSGKEGGFSIEDALCGGMLIDKLKSDHGKSLDLNDAGSLAHLLYVNNKATIRGTIAEGEHGRFLASLGFDGDVKLATDVDSIPVLPILRDGRLIRDE